MSDNNDLSVGQKIIVVFNAGPIVWDSAWYFSNHAGNGDPKLIAMILLHSVFVWLAWSKIL